MSLVKTNQFYAALALVLNANTAYCAAKQHGDARTVEAAKRARQQALRAYKAFGRHSSALPGV